MRALAIGLLFLASIVPPHVHAADLQFSAPADCHTEESVRAQVAALTQQALEDAQGLAFDVRISVDAQRVWHLQLQTRSAEERVSSREIAGASCNEVSGAAAVAIAMAIQERDAQLAEAPAEPAAVSGEPTPTKPTGAPPPADEAAPAPGPSLGAAAALAVDVGLLPALGVGAQVDLSAQWSDYRVIASGAFFAPQHVRMGPAAQGGEFGLALGVLAFCVEQRFSALGLGLCPGFELGSMSAEGLGVMEPHGVSRLVYGPRLELRSGFRIAGRIGIVAHVGLVFPLRRDRFALNNASLNEVHRASAMALRLGAGVEF